MTEEGTLPRATHTDTRPTHEPVSAATPTCQLRDVLDRVGDKWSVLVTALLGDGPLRYSQLQHGIDGISQPRHHHDHRDHA
ncbi:winged helix-turn-helix transcriptional regulator [Spirillospora sp. NPDC052269]